MGKTSPYDKSDVSVFDSFPTVCGFNDTEKDVFDAIEDNHRSDAVCRRNAFLFLYLFLF
jgi:hypothetical protein